MRSSISVGLRLSISVVALAIALMPKAACAGLITPNNLPTMTCGIEGANPSSWTFAPTINMFAPAPGGGYQMTSSPSYNILGGQAAITIQTLAFDPDPFVLNNVLVTNNTAITQVFTVFVALPTSFGAPNLRSGVIQMGVIDGGFDGATVASSGGLPIYQAQIDGVTVNTLFADPFSLTAPSAGVNSASSSFGPIVGGVPVTATMGIQLRFSLTAGDTASILSRFDVVAVPGPSAFAMLGIAVLGAPRRRRMS